MTVIEYRTADKSSWGVGPWQDEPDKKQWRDATTGYPCLIVRNAGVTGSLCGYVGVSPDHPAHGKNYDFWRPEGEPLTLIEVAINEISVHGGLTFASGCRHSADPAQGICHVPAEGEPDAVWWFGFDCSHAGDYSPAMDSRYTDKFSRLGAPTGWGGVIEYRDMAYVEASVADLAAQLKALAAHD